MRRYPLSLSFTHALSLSLSLSWVRVMGEGGAGRKGRAGDGCSSLAHRKGGEAVWGYGGGEGARGGGGAGGGV